MSPVSGQSRDTRAIILDSINDGVFTVDQDWRITSFNRAARADYGCQTPAGNWKTVLRGFSGEHLRDGLRLAKNADYRTARGQ